MTLGIDRPTETDGMGSFGRPTDSLDVITDSAGGVAIIVPRGPPLPKPWPYRSGSPLGCLSRASILLYGASAVDPERHRYAPTVCWGWRWSEEERGRGGEGRLVKERGLGGKHCTATNRSRHGTSMRRALLNEKS